jgi:hypothetical protein
MPGGTESYWDSTGEEWNPLLGAIFSMVRGRHGLNANVIYELNTGGDSQPDGFRYDASYLYRLSPATYGEESSGAAIYAVAEHNESNNAFTSASTFPSGPNFAAGAVTAPNQVAAGATFDATA